MNTTLPTFNEAKQWVKISFFTDRGYDIKGVIHVGANDWYEFNPYRDMGIEHLLGFEPLLSAIERFKSTHAPEEAQCLYPVALGSKNGTQKLLVASGDGQQSTFLEHLPEYREQYPDSTIVDTQASIVMTFEFFMHLHPEIKLSNYNCLVVDTEGYEMEVFKGMGDFIKNFEFLNIELSGKPRYVGGVDAKEVIAYLDKMGFRQESPIEDCNDVFFIRKDIS